MFLFSFLSFSMGRQSEKTDLKKRVEFIHFSDQTCRYKLYRYKLTVE